MITLSAVITDKLFHVKFEDDAGSLFTQDR